MGGPRGGLFAFAMNLRAGYEHDADAHGACAEHDKHDEKDFYKAAFHIFSIQETTRAPPIILNYHNRA